MSVADTVLAEAASYTVTRFAAGTRAKGVYTPGAGTAITRLMAVQPATGKEIDRLPEGARNRETLRCYSSEDLRAPEQGTSTGGDRFTYNGAVFEVVKVDDRSRDGGYWRAFAARVHG